MLGLWPSKLRLGPKQMLPYYYIPFPIAKLRYPLEQPVFFTTTIMFFVMLRAPVGSSAGLSAPFLSSNGLGPPKYWVDDSSPSDILLPTVLLPPAPFPSLARIQHTYDITYPIMVAPPAPSPISCSYSTHPRHHHPIMMALERVQDQTVR